MSAKIPIEPNQNCKDSFQTISPALRLSRSIAATLPATVPPLRRHKAEWPICYDSAIALKLAAHQQAPAPIAAQIAALCAIEGDWQIQIASSGLIRFQCSEPGIAALLQRSLSIKAAPTPKLYAVQSIPADLLFRVQYVHARCCLLLRSAQREGWFFKSNPPHPLPWLTDTSELRLQHSAERQAIGSLFDALDALAALQPSDRLWKQAANLSRCLDAFQSACRIWGEVKANDLPLAQARLGLIWAGQNLLQALLDRLGVDAPTVL